MEKKVKSERGKVKSVVRLALSLMENEGWGKDDRVDRENREYKEH